MVLEARLAKLRARLAHSSALVLVRLHHVASRIVNANHVSHLTLVLQGRTLRSTKFPSKVLHSPGVSDEKQNHPRVNR